MGQSEPVSAALAGASILTVHVKLEFFFSHDKIFCIGWSCNLEWETKKIGKECRWFDNYNEMNINTQ